MSIKHVHHTRIPVPTRPRAGGYEISEGAGGYGRVRKFYTRTQIPGKKFTLDKKEKFEKNRKKWRDFEIF